MAFDNLDNYQKGSIILNYIAGVILLVIAGLKLKNHDKCLLEGMSKMTINVSMGLLLLFAIAVIGMNSSFLTNFNDAFGNVLAKLTGAQPQGTIPGAVPLMRQPQQKK